MARYKDYDYRQMVMVAVDFSEQLLPGTFEHSLAYLVEHQMDFSGLDGRYANDDTGAPAYDPRILTKIVLYAYSRGITSSRQIARACEENVVFMALSANTRPHFTTIAGFVSGLDTEAMSLFRDVLMVCNEEGLIGKEMFAVDGVKLPSNASKEWSGTRADFERQVSRMEAAVSGLVSQHRRSDSGPEKSSKDDDGDDGDDGGVRSGRTHERLASRVRKLRQWLDTHDERVGVSGKAIKSNVTDNDSGLLSSSHGVVQGYTGVTVVDAAHQVIVNAEAYGQGHESPLFQPVLEGVRANFEAIAHRGDILKRVKVTADSGYHSRANVEWLYAEEIDGYLADIGMRQRDVRFDEAKGHHKPAKPLWGHRKKGRSAVFGTEDFAYDAKGQRCQCPAGHALHRNWVGEQQGWSVVRFKGRKSICGGCSLREQCLRHPETTAVRAVTFFGERKDSPEGPLQWMRRKIDSAYGKAQYGRRLGTAEPPFANIRTTLGLDRFTLRGKGKVNAQWLLYCLVHNIGKVHRYAWSG